MTDAPIWSGTDYPYQCLKDAGRTLRLMQGTSALTDNGDVVLDLGAGSGILSLAAAAAGAGKVYAVEVDPVLAECLRRTVHANGFQGTIEVLESDVMDLSGVRADVLLAELIDTGLLDEQFVPAMNHMWDTGVIDPRSRLLFEGYSTTVQLAVVDNEYYGFEILAPKHEWPFYDAPQAGTRWTHTAVDPIGAPIPVWHHDFASGPVDLNVGPVEFSDLPEANALILSGTARLGDGQEMGAFNAFNGIKVFPLDDRPVEAELLSISYELGGGLQSLVIEPVIRIAALDSQLA